VNGGAALIIAAALFSYALVLHVVAWRLRPPPKYLYWFLKYWLLLPLAAVCAFLTLESLRGDLSASQLMAWLGGFLTYLALCASFILIYPAISMSSLSLEILHHLRRPA
jgi:ATP/ADP translocase